MKITVDTNVLVRVVVRDDQAQTEAAEQVLGAASRIVITLPTLCEFVWVLRRAYRKDLANISQAIRILLDIPSVTVNRPAVEAGLQMMDAGCDFADGVIAYEGQWLGGDTFLSFDRQAVSQLHLQGRPAKLLHARQ